MLKLADRLLAGSIPDEFFRSCFFFVPWLISLMPRRSPISDRQPWITFQARRILRNAVKQGANVFEWGAGGSTLFFLDHGTRLITVEHNKKWMHIVKSQQHNPTDWNLHLIEPEPCISANDDISDPLQFRSGSPDMRNMSFRDYARQIENYPDRCFDIILIDGRARPSCLMLAAKKVRLGGIIVLDNSNRPYYTSQAMASLAPFNFQKTVCHGVSPYVDFTTQTTIWRLEPPDKVIIGSGGVKKEWMQSWFSTDIYSLDICRQDHYPLHFQKNSVSCFFAEHVVEHLTEKAFRQFLTNARPYLEKNGVIRIGVPDGCFPNQAYIDAIKPGGSGDGADDHKMLYTCDKMVKCIQACGYAARLVEWWDDAGRFHQREMNPEYGLISRSRYHDPRNANGSIRYTSLIVDAIKT